MVGGRQSWQWSVVSAITKTHVAWLQTNNLSLLVHACLCSSSVDQGELLSLLVHSMEAKGSWPAVTKGSKRLPMAEGFGLWKARSILNFMLRNHWVCWVKTFSSSSILGNKGRLRCSIVFFSLYTFSFFLKHIIEPV